MVVGVCAFTFANGSLASILSHYDAQNAALQDKIVILNKIYKDYNVPVTLYAECKKHLESNIKNDYSKL